MLSVLIFDPPDLFAVPNMFKALPPGIKMIKRQATVGAFVVFRFE